MEQDAELVEEAAEAARGPSAADRARDQRVILGNTGQNVLGLAIGALATFAAQVIMTRRLGDDGFGVVTLTTQFAFIAAAATRFGMDVANVRLVAILVGRNEAARSRGLVRRSVAIALGVSVPLAVLAFAVAPWLAETFSGLPDVAVPAFRWAAVTIPIAALAFTYMGATRGLKIMRYTLYSQWTAQPIGWIVLTLGFWAAFATTPGWASAAFGASWALALLIAWYGWEKEQRRFPPAAPSPGIPEEHTGSLLRFGALRAPATLFSQLIFWTDFFVLSALMSSLGREGAAQVGVYGAVLRAGQSLFLFLTSVSLTFSPFVADLHHRGEREHLDSLYKQVTRWTLAATIPVLLVLAVLPEQVLRIFGAEFTGGDGALRILIVGMIVPVMVGTVGFILIMAGRTGWDLLVYLGGFAIDIGLALLLARPEALGIRGAAIAQAATLTFSAVARLLLVRRFLRIWPFDRDYLRLAVPSVAGAGAMLATHVALPEAEWLVNLVGSFAVGGLAYAATLLLWGLPSRERRAAFRLAGRLLGRSTAPGGVRPPRVRPLVDGDREDVRRLLLGRWGSPRMAAHGVVYEPAKLDGFVAEDPDTGELLGLLTYHLTEDACEIVTIDALVERRGVGTALLEAAAALGRERLWVVTTNDNASALDWYQRRGFRVVAVHEGAVDRARRSLKPEIPRSAPDGTPIRDEIELERPRS
jgi:O-antigen/teichoic acid export membrane protein/GNAT superfamily N-acetyltransferase